MVKAHSKKDVRTTLGVDLVEYWSDITKKHERLLSNLAVCNGKPMKLFYCVSTTVFPNGRTFRNFEVSRLAEERPANSFESTNRGDCYLDWFDSKEEAEKFIAENK